MQLLGCSLLCLYLLFEFWLRSQYILILPLNSFLILDFSVFFFKFGPNTTFTPAINSSIPSIRFNKRSYQNRLNISTVSRTNIGHQLVTNHNHLITIKTVTLDGFINATCEWFHGTAHKVHAKTRNGTIDTGMFVV